MAEEDWYAVLGVATTATEEDIKKAYRQKAMETHPDRNPGNVEAETYFKKITEAYSILKDTEKRRSYDRTKSGSMFLNLPPKTEVVSAVNDILDETLFDKLDQIMGRVPHKKNIEIKVNVSVEDIYNGVDKTVSFKRNEKCEGCKGRGALNREDFKLCDVCYGLGHAPRLSTLWKKNKSRCSRCKGIGKVILNKCKECKGSGLCKKEVELVIPIPRGLSLKDKLIVTGEGEGEGDLVIEAALEAHKFFEVSGNDLIVEIPVSFSQAALGDYLQIDTLKGSAYFKIDSGSQPGDSITLKGYGLRNGEAFGDLLIKLSITIPHVLSSEQKGLLEKYRETEKRRTTT